MLLPEARLATLIDQLEGLPRGDRRAILKRLSSHERMLVRRHMQGGEPGRVRSPFSPDIAARIAAGDATPITEAGRDALARAAASISPPEPNTGSLLEAIMRLLRLPQVSA